MVASLAWHWRGLACDARPISLIRECRGRSAARSLDSRATRLSEIRVFRSCSSEVKRVNFLTSSASQASRRCSKTVRSACVVDRPCVNESCARNASARWATAASCAVSASFTAALSRWSSPSPAPSVTRFTTGAKNAGQALLVVVLALRATSDPRNATALACRSIIDANHALEANIAPLAALVAEQRFWNYPFRATGL